MRVITLFLILLLPTSLALASPRPDTELNFVTHNN